MTASENPTTPARPVRRVPRPSLALFVALIALVMATTATSNALPGRNRVETNDIRNGAVTTPKLRNGAVTTPKLRNGAVTTPKLRNGAVATVKIKNGAVAPAKLKENAMWALVQSNGTFLQGAGVDTVQRIGTGSYAIEFDRRVTAHSLSATPYYPSVGHVSPLHCGGPVTVCGFAGLDDHRTVYVLATNTAGAIADSYFLLTVHPSVPGTQVKHPRGSLPRLDLPD